MSDSQPEGTFLQPVSAELARVLAEAANSAFTPPIFYVVCRYEPLDPDTSQAPFNVQRPVATYEEAQQRVNELAKEEPNVPYGIFGPFQNSQGPVPAAVDQGTVDEFLVTVRRGTRVEEPFRIGGQEFDALFYSSQAVQKFVLAYYVQEYGTGFGERLIAAFNTAPLALMAHLPWSEEVDVASPQGGDTSGTAKTRYVPVFFERDASGAVQRRQLLPSAPGNT
jgi:hypothetical protein